MIPLKRYVLLSAVVGSARLTDRISTEDTTDIDLAASADGKYLFTLNAANGSIGEFAIDASTGLLTTLGVVEGLPAAAGLNGIAAN